MDELSPGERLIIEMIGEGRTDAEIAVRLDTSVAAVKARIAELLRARGLGERHELAGASQEDAALAHEGRATETTPRVIGSSQRLPRLAWSLTATAMLALLAAVALWTFSGGSEEPDPRPRAIQQEPVFDALSTEDEISMLDQSVRASPDEGGPAPWCLPPGGSMDTSAPAAMGMVPCGAVP